MNSSTDSCGMLRSRSACTARSRSFGASARARATSSSAVGMAARRGGRTQFGDAHGISSCLAQIVRRASQAESSVGRGQARALIGCRIRCHVAETSRRSHGLLQADGTARCVSGYS